MNTNDPQFPTLEWFCAFAGFDDDVREQIKADMRRTATLDAKQEAEAALILAARR